VFSVFKHKSWVLTRLLEVIFAFYAYETSRVFHCLRFLLHGFLWVQNNMTQEWGEITGPYMATHPPTILKLNQKLWESFQKNPPIHLQQPKHNQTIQTTFYVSIYTMHFKSIE
jgi:hypothetical protein